MAPGHTADDVAHQMGWNRSTCFNLARDMGLPTRVELRKAAGFPSHGSIAAGAERFHAYNVDAQLAKLEQALAEDDGGPPPVERNYCYVCGAPCPLDAMGHTSCTGRKAA